MSFRHGIVEENLTSGPRLDTGMSPAASGFHASAQGHRSRVRKECIDASELM